jgi:hypothetical protein
MSQVRLWNEILGIATGMVSRVEKVETAGGVGMILIEDLGGVETTAMGKADAIGMKHTKGAVVAVETSFRLTWVDRQSGGCERIAFQTARLGPRSQVEFV